MALAYALTGSLSDAHDVAQDVLISAARRWDEISSYQSPSAWARRAVMNRSTSIVRRRVADGKRLLRLQSRVTLDSASMPDESAELWQRVRQLPLRQRQVVTLRVVLELSLQEIADVLGVSKTTAQVHLERALNSLREGFGNDD